MLQVKQLKKDMLNKILLQDSVFINLFITEWLHVEKVFLPQFDIIMHIFVRMRRFSLILKTIDILCLVYTNFCANKPSINVNRIQNQQTYVYVR